MSVWLRPVRALRRDRSGNVSIMFAGSLVMLLGTSALGIDTASLYLEKRRLQGIADAAALAAASDIAAARVSAGAAITANDPTGVTLSSIATGSYAADPTIASSSRFVAGAPSPSAAKVTLESRAATFFARVFTGQRTVPVSASATAARIDLAAFSIGSRLASVSGGLPNALLSGLAGTELNLSVMDYNSLVSTNIDVLRFSEALRSRIDVQAATFGETLNARATLPQVISALAAATDSQPAATILGNVASRLTTDRVQLSSIIDLGPLAAQVHADPTKPVYVDAFSILRAVLEIGGANRQIATDVGLTIPGLASSRLTLEIGERPNSSPWLSVNAARQIHVRTAQTRMFLDATLASVAPLGLTVLHVPIFIELASADATLASVSCSRGRANASATLEVIPSLGQVAIADIDTGTFGDFTRAVTLRRAVITGSAVASVTAYANVRLGGVTAQSVAFTADDIANHRMKTVSTGDLARGVATSLLGGVDLQVNVIGLPIGTGAITTAVGTLLAAAATPLDTLVDQVTALAGVRVGQADVWVNGVRCGTPMLVA